MKVGKKYKLLFVPCPSELMYDVVECIGAKDKDYIVEDSTGMVATYENVDPQFYMPASEVI